MKLIGISSACGLNHAKFERFIRANQEWPNKLTGLTRTNLDDAYVAAAVKALQDIGVRRIRRGPMQGLSGSKTRK